MVLNGLNIFDSSPTYRERANSLIESIRGSAVCYDPFELLALTNKISAWEWVISSFDLPYCPPGLFRAGEYLQSVLVSTPSPDSEARCLDCRVVDLVHEVSDLYDDVLYLNGLDGLSEKADQLTKEQRSAVSTMQTMYHVRGRRDATFQRWYYSFLLQPQDELIKKLWGVDAGRLVDGIDALLARLRFGIYRTYKLDQKKFSSDFYRLDHLPSREAMIDSFDVEKITGWPSDFVQELSLPIGGDTSFYKGGFPGSPDNTYILRERPFVQIAGRHFAFNYYLVADFFYRAIQRCVDRVSQTKHGSEEWNKNQCAATEAEALRMLKALLPHAQIHSNNHYKTGPSSNDQGENDLLAVWQDILVIGEIKGRRRWANPPTENASAMVNLNFSDIKDAVEQCDRTERYIRESDAPVFYEEGWRARKPIRLGQIRRVFKIVIILDGENEITSCHDLLKGITDMVDGVLCISFDDLHVYEKYFEDQPLFFLCYLNERLRAASITNLKTFDELDHLAAYIRNPRYVDEAIQCRAEGYTFVNPGSFEELNDFFIALNNPGVDVKIPRLELPQTIYEILEMLQRCQPEGFLDGALWLLHLHPKAQAYVAEMIDAGVRQMRQTGKVRLSGYAKVSSREAVVITVCEPFYSLTEGVEEGLRAVRREIKRLGLVEMGYILLGYNGCMDYALVQGVRVH